ncbi:MAG: hypothetical protein R3F62_26855 [Planctomycetota bacterium]
MCARCQASIALRAGRRSARDGLPYHTRCLEREAVWRLGLARRLRRRPAPPLPRKRSTPARAAETTVRPIEAPTSQCPLCRDDVVRADGRVCSTCGAVCHPGCVAELGGCHPPTTEPAVAATPQPRGPRTPRRGPALWPRRPWQAPTPRTPQAASALSLVVLALVVFLARVELDVLLKSGDYVLACGLVLLVYVFSKSLGE